jgi:N-dimethylarginine dimethylaminohydrolase
LGIPFIELTPDKELPDQVYTTDNGHAENNIFIQSNFRYPQRRPESAIVANVLKEKGYTVYSIPNEIFFEGQGDFVRNTTAYFLGYGKRSSREAGSILSHILKKPVYEIELVDGYFYHLDTCFSSLSTEIALAYRPAFTTDGFEKISSHFKTVIEVTKEDASAFVCNLMVYEKYLIVNSGISHSLREQLQALGFEVHTTDMSEYIKGGGSVKCVSLQLYDK